VPAAITQATPQAPAPRRSPANDIAASSLRSVPPLANAEERAVVRVPVRRLDALLAQSGELAVARRRFETRREEIVALHEAVMHLRGNFRAFGERSRRISLVSSGKGGAAVSERRQAAGTSERLLQTTAEALEHIEADLSRLSSAVTDDLRNLERAAAPLERQVHRVRMLAFGEACEGLQRAVRDLGTAQHKDIDFAVEGADIELDRAIIEGARSALLHLVRNAVDHGIEAPDVRARAGKAARASLIVRAAIGGDRVEISVSDDGRGLDLEAIAATARARGLHIPDDERELRRLIFEPGFSTASKVTDVSGRGVGLDVVRAQVESFRGEVDVSFERGRGTRFVLKLPLTTSTLRALLVTASDQSFAIPNSSVRSLVRAASEQIGHVEGREMLLAAGGPMPLCSLRNVLGLTGNEPARGDGKLPVVVLEADGRSVALSVDGWIAEQDLVLKQLGRRVKRVRHVSAAAMLPSGQLALLLKTHELVRSALALAPVRRLAAQLEPQQAISAKRVLLVDDSVTTRTLERSILEASGYEVIPAADGAQAFKLLQEKGADIVVSDVEMPRMDGFMLTEAIRGSKRFRELPVVLLTALGSEEDRARGLACGADAYLVKSAFDQDELLELLRQLI
jgi:two-component system chemotaxis sensor kinase CheA